jgi:Mg2+ and Co2+ transporter CorA
MDEQGYKDQIAALEKEVDALEEVVRVLEAEGLKPLVDRLRSQILSIKKLTKAMATAIDELLERNAKDTK